ncbi:MAG TPA: hypothetical protein VFE33_26545 [Thermoanaerobaculia bacterium]|nr:hypothetical protein [Thermoanaerobaculia bacterium]
MKRATTLCALALAGVWVAAAPAAAKGTDCQMKFTLKGWSAFYKVAHGRGTITCDNGEKATVTLEAKGGGLTAGRSEIRNGLGKFNEVGDISELFGTYVQAGATAGAVKAAGASAMTKGEVSLALSGKGSGFELGVAFGKFTITKQ